jgi:hypothetical protein
MGSDDAAVQADHRISAIGRGLPDVTSGDRIDLGVVGQSLRRRPIPSTTATLEFPTLAHAAQNTQRPVDHLLWAMAGENTAPTAAFRAFHCPERFTQIVR